MTDSPYLQRASEMDALAVSVATTLTQSLTLIHGGALIAIPAFAAGRDQHYRGQGRKSASLINCEAFIP